MFSILSSSSKSYYVFKLPRCSTWQQSYQRALRPADDGSLPLNTPSLSSPHSPLQVLLSCLHVLLHQRPHVEAGLSSEDMFSLCSGLDWPRSLTACHRLASQEHGTGLQCRPVAASSSGQLVLSSSTASTAGPLTTTSLTILWPQPAQGNIISNNAIGCSM